MPDCRLQRMAEDLWKQNARNCVATRFCGGFPAAEAMGSKWIPAVANALHAAFEMGKKERGT